MVLRQIKNISDQYLRLTNLYYAKNFMKQKIKSLFIKFQKVLKVKEYEDKLKKQESELEQMELIEKIKMKERLIGRMAK